MPLNLYTGLNFDFENVFFSKLSSKQQAAYLDFVELFDAQLDNFRIAHNIGNLSPDEEPDEETKLRFLKADSFHVKKASARLLNTILWRKEQKASYLANNPPECFELYNKHRIHRIIGYDRSSRPIKAERFGETLAIANLKVMPIEDWMQCIIHDTEQLIYKLREISEKKGDPVGNHISIMDLKGGTLFSAFKNLSFFQKLEKSLSPHYPELADRILVFHAPLLATAFYNNVVRRFVDEETASKVELYTNVPVDVLEKLADISQFPEEYGGSNTDPEFYPHRIGIK